MSISRSEGVSSYTIGLSVIENGKITDSYYYLVNPECEFDRFNISIHGISHEDVVMSPTFNSVWEEIGDLFRGNLVVAHNATFDLSVLKKVLNFYGLIEKSINYICTMKLSKEMNNNVCDYKLPTLCNYFGINNDHHNAESDSAACANILCNYINSGVNLHNHVNNYDLSHENLSNSNPNQKISTSTLSLLQLNEILEGITCDNILTEDEVGYLVSWMDSNSALRGNYPYDSIFNILSTALADGLLEKQELDEMMMQFRRLSDPLSDRKSIFNDIRMENVNVCLSGEFKHGSKSDIGTLLVDLGATIQSNVTQSTNYLIVGGQGSSAWCAGSYGSKVKKALEMQTKGHAIVIVKEADFFEALGNKK